MRLVAVFDFIPLLGVVAEIHESISIINRNIEHSESLETQKAGYFIGFLGFAQRVFAVLNREKVAASKYRVSAFRPEICAIAEVLGAAIGDDTELQSGITKLLEEHDEQARVDPANGQNGVVLRAVLIHCHENNQEQVSVREITATANEIYHEEGESLRITNETVGHVLKGLGLYSRRLGNAGRGLILDKATQSRVHRLSQAYEVLPVVPTCGFCQSIQVTQPQAVVQDV
jgi:hypothetical protein